MPDGPQKIHQTAQASQMIVAIAPRVAERTDAILSGSDGMASLLRDSSADLLAL